MFSNYSRLVIKSTFISWVTFFLPLIWVILLSESSMRTAFLWNYLTVSCLSLSIVHLSLNVFETQNRSRMIKLSPFLFVGVASVFLLVNPSFIVEYITGKEHATTWGLSFIAMCLTLFFVKVNFIRQVIRANGRAHYAMASSAVDLSALIVFGSFLYCFFGLNGLGFAVFVSHLIGFVFLLVLARPYSLKDLF